MPRYNLRPSLRQNYRAISGDGDAVFEVSAVAAVGGDSGPLIAQETGFRLSVIHHRLDGDDHALAQSGTPSSGTKVWNLRLFVQTRADSVSNELAHHAEAVGLDVVCRGLSMVIGDDEILAVTGPLFDGLYEYRQRAMLLGREPG